MMPYDPGVVLLLQNPPVFKLTILACDRFKELDGFIGLPRSILHIGLPDSYLKKDRDAASGQVLLSNDCCKMVEATMPLYHLRNHWNKLFQIASRVSVSNVADASLLPTWLKRWATKWVDFRATAA